MKQQDKDASPAARRLVLAAMLVTIPPAGNAGGGATGGALEATQLLNHAELIAQVGEAVQTTSNTLMTAQSTMQMLRQLSPGSIAEMMGLPIDQVEQLAQAYTVMSEAQGVYQDASNVLRQAAYDAETYNITPAELLRYKADAAYKYGGVYQTAYQNEQEKLARLTAMSGKVQEQATKIEGIDANVKGLQFVANQNVQVQTLLAGISESIATANTNASMEAEKKKYEEAQIASDEATMLDKLSAARGSAKAKLPLPGEVQIVKKPGGAK